MVSGLVENEHFLMEIFDGKSHGVESAENC